MNQQFTIKSRKEISTQIINLTGDIGWSILFSFPLLLAGLILITIPERYQAEVDFRSRALLTTGIIMETKEHQSCSGSYGSGYSCRTECDMRVKFKSNTENSAIFWENCSVNASKNQLISILYDPKKISRARVFNRGDTPKSRAVNQLIFSLFLAVISLPTLLQHKKDLKRS
jgi:hypothetical protein